MISPSASCAPNASAPRCANARCSISDVTSMPTHTSGPSCAGASTTSSPVSSPCPPIALRRSNRTPARRHRFVASRERAARCWLGERSALGELLGVEFAHPGADAPVSRLRCADGAPRGHRAPSVRPRDGPVRPPPHRHALRPDQDLLRGRGARPGEGATRTLQGQAHRLPAPHPGPGPRRQRIRPPLAGLRRQRARTLHACRDARCARRPARRAGGDGPRHRH